MMIGLAVYLAICAASGVSGICTEVAYRSKLKRLGYISTKPELHGAEKRLDTFMDVVKTLACFLIPIVNIAFIVMLFNFEKFSDDLINSSLKDGNIKKVDLEELTSDEPGYLQKRIEEIKKFQMEMGKKNIPRTYSEMSYDEKIDVLLHELQLAFEEKAEAEGIDLDSVQPIIEDMPAVSRPKELKKSL